MAKWVLVDALNLAFRCFYAVPELSRSDGFPTNALHGWVRSLWRISDDGSPCETVVVFDFGEDAEKKRLLPQYKANRKDMPEPLFKQLPHMKMIASLMGFHTAELFETEADDLIATFAARYAGRDDEVCIVSADKDLAQCVRPGVEMWLPPPPGRSKAGWTRLDEAGVREKFGVDPERIPDLLALVGDSSDNIPGLSGVGPKTAVKWLREHETLEGVLSQAGTLTPKRFRQQVADSREDLLRNYRLTRLNRNVPLPELEKRSPDVDGLRRLLEQMEMQSASAEAEKRYER